MNFSVKINLRRPVRRDGTCSIRIQIIVGSEVWPRNLDLSWPEWLFDEDQGVCLASLPPADRPADYPQRLAAACALYSGTPKMLAKRASDYNLLIGQALAKANLVRVNWRLSGEVMTLERFKRDFETEGSKTDFVTYFRNKIVERHRKGMIGDTTRKNHFSTLNALAAFRPVVPFSTLTTEFADDFNRYLLKHVPGVNTRWGRHKDVKTYLAKAKEDKLRFEDPYKNFKNRDEPGKWKPLKSDELAKLEHYYRLCGPRTVHRRILAKFLFSCSSSLRLGDLKRIANAKVENQEMTLKVHKTYTTKKQLVDTMLPLTNKALGYLRDAQEEEELPGFRNYADQYSNRTLTAIGLQLGILSRMHWHVGRETFATEFIRRGGQVAVLQKLMDHAKISTTMKYVHVDDDMKRAAIDRLNRLDEAQ